MELVRKTPIRVHLRFVFLPVKRTKPNTWWRAPIWHKVLGKPEMFGADLVAGSVLRRVKDLMVCQVPSLALIFLPVLAACGSCAIGPELREIALVDTAGWAHDIALDGKDLYVSDRQGGFVVFDRRKFGDSPLFSENSGGRRESDSRNRGAVPDFRVMAPVTDVISLAPNSGRPLLAARFEGLVLISQSGKVLARFANGDIANAVETRGDLAFVAYGLHGLVVARVEDSGIRVISELPSPGWSHGLRVSGDRVFLADWNYGLRVIDIHDPGKPSEIGVLPTPATTISVALHEQGGRLLAALADGHAGVALVDIDAAGHPSLLSRNRLGLNPTDQPHPENGGWAHGVAWSGNYLFVANWKRGLAVLDVRDIRNPILINERRTTGTALAVAAERQQDGSDLVFLADGEAGLRVLRFMP